MPRIRTLTRDSETSTLTTFSDPTLPATPGSVLVTTDATSGDPTALTASGVSYALTSTSGTTRAWLAVVDGHNKQVNTFGGFPGMTANAAN